MARYVRSASSSDPDSRGTVLALCWALAYQGYTFAINGPAAPFIARSFGLNDAGIATLYACITASAIGVFALSRMADRVGRRRLVILCLAATPVAALAAAGADTLVRFAIVEIVLYTLIGATISGAVVLLAEALPVALRARGQAFGGLAAALGAGLCLIVTPLLDAGGHSWRWLLVISGAGIVTVPFVAWALPESRLWEHAAAAAPLKAAQALDVLRSRYGARAVAILTCSFLSVMALSSADGWTYYHAVTVVGLSPAKASTLILVAGGLGLVGFPLGAWACEHFGRVRAVTFSWVLASGAALLFYWGPPPASTLPTALWLGVGFFGLFALSSTALVGFRAASTELFPTALRGTMIGLTSLAGALGSVTAQAIIAAMSGPLGGISVVVGFISLLALPAALVFARFVDETQGLALEAAAREGDR